MRAERSRVSLQGPDPAQYRLCCRQVFVATLTLSELDLIHALHVGHLCLVVPVEPTQHRTTGRAGW